MALSILRSIIKQVVMILLVMLILFALYLSLGRQLMPEISRFKAQVEEQISTITGIGVSIDSLTGFFDGFNPAISVSGLSFQVNDDDPEAQPQASALEFETAIIRLDMARSIWQRQIVVLDFSVEGLAVRVRQTETGSWQISGMTLNSQNSLDPEAVFTTIQRVSQLQLTDLDIDLQSLAGNVTRLRDSTASIQNAQGRHFFHLDTAIEGRTEQISVSVEVSGNSLNELAGMVHVTLPVGDYSASTEFEMLGNIVLGKMIGGGQFWATLRAGQITGITVQPDIDSLNFALAENSQLSVENISGRASWLRDIDSAGWEFATSDLAFDFSGQHWNPTDAVLQFDGDNILRAKAEAIDLQILKDAMLGSGLLGAGPTSQLEAYHPRGVLRNLSALVPLQADSRVSLEFASNVDNLAVESVGKIPSVAGVSGYVEVRHDFGSATTEGYADVESENFAILIPSLFAEKWNYDYINGRLTFSVSAGEQSTIRLASSMVVAESEIVDGRAQFSINIARDGGLTVANDFNLLVGAKRADGSKTSPYLPSAPTLKPGLASTMQWLDGAVKDAAVYGSGIVFQGSLLPDALPEEKSFQGYLVFDEGHFNYAQPWPDIYEASGVVVIDNTDINVDVTQALSNQLTLSDASAKVRNAPGGGQWITITGDANGSTQAGLDFLRLAPLNNSLSETLEGWQAQGDVSAQLGLDIPLGIPSAAIHVDVSAQLDNNSLILPQYQLQFDEVGGVVNFDSINGIHDSELQSRFFEEQAGISVSARPNSEGNFVTDVNVRGSVDGSVLAQWPLQSEFVKVLLSRTSGSLNYNAQLTVQQDSTQKSLTTLKINSDLQGIELQVPQPFGKQAFQPKPLSLTLDIDNDGTRIQGALGSELTLRISLRDGALSDGIVYAGTVPGIANPWLRESDQAGVELRGNLDILNVSEWLEIISSTRSDGDQMEGLSNWLSVVNLDIGTLDVYGQQIESINVEIQDVENTDYWTIGLVSNAVSGSVLVPFDRDEYIEAYLAFLRLPGRAEDDADETPTVESVVDETAIIDIDTFMEEVFDEAEKIDALAGIDPRNLPRLKFLTGNLTIGERDYGLGQFTLDPDEEGAEFSNIIVNFRGLQVEPTDAGAPRFSWRYDGNEHHSYLSGVILTDNLARVLTANGYADSLESSSALFNTNLDWPGSPAFFSAANLNGNLQLQIEDGRFLQSGGSPGALKLISIINFSAIMRRARFSDDLLRSGLAYENITGDVSIENGLVTIKDQLVIRGPSSVYQIGGKIDLKNQTIDGEMYVTLPVSDNIPWLGLLTANIPIAIGAFLFDRIFGDQVDSLTSAQYTLSGPWEGLVPQFKQAFGTPPSNGAATSAPQAQN